MRCYCSTEKKAYSVTIKLGSLRNLGQLLRIFLCNERLNRGMVGKCFGPLFLRSHWHAVYNKMVCVGNGCPVRLLG